jgi:hypothetical protein
VAYVQTGDPLDKAGAYAIQHPGFQPVESMRGCYASVMGLPMCHVMRTLRSLDVPTERAVDVPMACQNLLNYECPVSSAILRGEVPSSPTLPPLGEGSPPLPRERARGEGCIEKETNESTTLGKLYSDTGFSHFMQY